MALPDHDAAFGAAIDALRQEGRYRVFTPVGRRAGHFPQAVLGSRDGGPEITVWCSNDYLGMGQHPAVIAAMQAALSRYGAGAGGTRNISGNSLPVVALEQTLADWHHKEAALLFTSGYAANQGTLAVLGRLLPGAAVFSDAHNHASIIEGIRLSGMKRHIFPHNDLDSLEGMLAATPPDQPKIIVLESVYSMDGDFGPVAGVAALAKRHGALTFLDEVHAVGLYGPEGAGLARQLGCDGDIDVIQGTLGKAVGIAGGYITGSRLLVDAVRSHAASFIFTTAPPPAVAAGAIASIGILRSGDGDALRRLQRQRVTEVRTELARRDIPFLPSPGHIVPVMVGDPVRCKAASDTLLDKERIYIQPINYPTVPRGTERLRITPGPGHDSTRILALADALGRIFRRPDQARESNTCRTTASP